MPILTDFNSMFTSLRQGFDSRMASGTLTMDQVVQETHELTDRIAREQIQDYVQVLDERLRNPQLRKKEKVRKGLISVVSRLSGKNHRIPETNSLHFHSLREKFLGSGKQG